MRATKWQGLGVLLAVGVGAALTPPTPVAAATTVAAINKSSPDPPITGFAGYQWHGVVTSIGARWQVPRILSKGASSASTWIGVQSPGGDSQFVQLGTVEYKPTPSVVEYFAFWSDTGQSFYPVNLGVVSPGENISASMDQIPSGWKLDLTENGRVLASNLQVAVPSTGSYDQAEWIQEDPPPSLLASQDEPFPLLSRIRFTNVVVDKSIPHLVFSDAQALASISGRSLVPTRVAADSFSFAPATGIAQQYLSEALKYDDAAVRYETATRSWGEDSVSTRSSMVANFAHAMKGNLSQIGDIRWPRSARPYAERLTAVERRASTFLTGWLASGGARGDSPPVLPASLGLSPVADRLRAKIGLPPV